jgi:hypothetical protein
MTVPPRISEKNSQSDLFLFTAGGCHIFCRTLLELLPAENFELRHLHAKAQFLDKPGYHIYLFRSGYAVDALGIRREEDMIALFTGQRGWSFTPEPCSVHSCLQKRARRRTLALSMIGICTCTRISLTTLPPGQGSSSMIAQVGIRSVCCSREWKH